MAEPDRPQSPFAGILRGNLAPLQSLCSVIWLRGYRCSGRDRSTQPLPGAVAHFQRAMIMEVDQAAKAMRDEEMNAEIEDFLEGFNQPTAAACGSMGFGSLPGHPGMGGLVIRGQTRSGSNEPQ